MEEASDVIGCKENENWSPASNEMRKTRLVSFVTGIWMKFRSGIPPYGVVGLFFVHLASVLFSSFYFAPALICLPLPSYQFFSFQ